MNSKRKLIVGVLAFLVVMTMGYALFSETVTIGGTAKGEGNLSVIFNDIDMSAIDIYGSGKINKIALTNNKKTLDIDISFDYPSSSISIPITIKNNGTIDAYIKKINIKGLDNYGKYDDWLKKDLVAILLNENAEDISKSELEIIRVGEVKNYNLEIIWNNGIDNIKNNLKSNFSVELEYVQFENGLIGNDTEVINKYAIGNKFCLGSECFNIIKDNGKTVTALSSYNLTNKGEIIKQISSIDPMDYLYAFANTDESRKLNGKYIGYWADNQGKLKPEYGSDYPSEIYYTKNQDSNNIKPVLLKYMDYLKSIGFAVTNPRLVTKNELIELGCNENEKTCTSSIYADWLLNKQSSWSSTATAFDTLKIISAFGTFNDIIFNNNDSLGIRPVIEIDKSLINK